MHECRQQKDTNSRHERYDKDRSEASRPVLRQRGHANEAIKYDSDHSADRQDGYSNTCNQPASTFAHTLWQGELHSYASSKHVLRPIFPHLRLPSRIGLRRNGELTRDPPLTST